MNTIKKILAQIRKADETYNLIEDGDKIAIGLSGGKDSSLLLYSLHLYQYLAKNTWNKNFEIIGIHLDMNFGEEDMSPMYDFFKNNNIKVIEEKTKLADILALHKKDDKIQCSLCSQLKKGAVIKTAKEQGCNKVAFGHHIDDAIETLFLNSIYGGRLSTFDPKMYLTNSEITFIRPFCLCREKDIKKATKELAIPALKSGCPNDGFTKRQDIKELLNNIYHQYPQARKNFEYMITNNEGVNLYKENKD